MLNRSPGLSENIMEIERKPIVRQEAENLFEDRLPHLGFAIIEIIFHWCLDLFASFLGQAKNEESKKSKIKTKHC
jgi:hypothetical protein